MDPPNISLLDTPRKTALQQQSKVLRDNLKEFERSFAADHDGAKPGRSDIKAHPSIAEKYKEYNRVRDVLSGKVSSGVLEETQRSPVKRRKSKRLDTGQVTPSKRRRREEETAEENNELEESPRPVFLTAIGPTPQRDGRALGLFDLLSNSASSRHSVQTPSQNRKRKIQEIYADNQEIVGQEEAGIAQTPTQHRQKRSGDILEFLSAHTPLSKQETGRRKLSKTPVSEGRKFVLSQFFATPNAARFSQFLDDDVERKGQEEEENLLKGTPFQAKILGLDTPQKHQRLALEGEGPHLEPDATPAYLKRSFSFKERLLSATTSKQPDRSAELETVSKVPPRKGTRIFQRTRSGPKLLSQIVAELRDIENGQHDDDLDALREFENIGDDGPTRQDADASDRQEGNGNQEQVPTRVWKKKGQKRTTRRAIIRPSKMAARVESKFVAADDEEYEDDDGDVPQNEAEVALPDQSSTTGARNNNEVTNLTVVDSSHNPPTDLSEDEFDPADFDDDEDFINDTNDPAFSTKTSNTTTKTNHDLPRSSNPPNPTMGPKNSNPQAPSKHHHSKSNPDNPGGKEKSKPRQIDPNAHSHMNFRSLKIKNKNSRAKRATGKGFRGRFGRR